MRDVSSLVALSDMAQLGGVVDAEALTRDVLPELQAFVLRHQPEQIFNK